MHVFQLCSPYDIWHNYTYSAASCSLNAQHEHKIAQQ